MQFATRMWPQALHRGRTWSIQSSVSANRANTRRLPPDGSSARVGIQARCRPNWRHRPRLPAIGGLGAGGHDVKGRAVRARWGSVSRPMAARVRAGEANPLPTSVRHRPRVPVMGGLGARSDGIPVRPARARWLRCVCLKPERAAGSSASLSAQITAQWQQRRCGVFKRAWPTEVARQAAPPSCGRSHVMTPLPSAGHRNAPCQRAAAVSTDWLGLSALRAAAHLR